MKYGREEYQLVLQTLIESTEVKQEKFTYYVNHRQRNNGL